MRARTCLACAKRHASCVRGGAQGAGRGQSAGRKRKWAAVEDVVVISEASEDIRRTPVLRKRPDKDNLFDFELDEDGTMAPLPVNPFWSFWEWSKVVEMRSVDLQRTAKAWRDEAREQRERVKTVEKEVKRLRERVMELEKGKGKEKEDE